MTAVTASPVTRSRAPIALLIWLIAAVALGPWLFASIPFPGPQLLIVAIAVVATFGLRGWFDTLSWRALVGMHALRLVGIVFLILGARGLLAQEFATRAGWGDIIAALGAIGLVLAGPRPKWLANTWNVFGLLDLIVAVITASLVPGMQLITQLPLVLVPTFFVPFFIAAHVATFRRINAA